VAGGRTAATIEDLTVVGTTSACELGYCHLGTGAWAEDGATLELTRARLEDNTVYGLLAEGEGTRVTAADLAVAGTRGSGSAELPPAGVDARDGAAIELNRASVDGNAGAGVRVAGVGTTAELADVVIAGTTPFELAMGLAAGLAVSDEAAVALTRALVSENAELGVFVDGASRLDLDGVLIEATLERDDGRFGRGLEIEGGAAVTMRSGQLVGNRDVALAVFGPDSELALEHVLVADTAARGCVELPDPDTCEAGRGYGLGVYERARVEVDDVEVRASEGVGVQLAGGGALAGAGLVVHGCAVGLDLEGMPRSQLEAGLEELVLANNEVDGADAEMSVPELVPR
jgi:hypothetical protein